MIYVGFSSMFNVVSSEYLIYSFVDIVAAIGGGLGLFLGVSLLQVKNKESGSCQCEQT